MNASWENVLSWISQHWLLERLFFASLEFAALAVIAAVVLWMVKPRTPRLVALVWALVLAKPLVSLLMGSPLPVIRFPAPKTQPVVALTNDEGLVLEGTHPGEKELAHSRAEDGGAITFPLKRENDSGSRERNSPQGPRSIERVAVHTEDAPAVSAVAGRQTSAGRWNWQLAVVAFWFGGVALLAVRALIVRRRLARIFASGKSPEKPVHDLYLAAATAMNVSRPPGLLITDALESPALVGLWCTRILIPEWLAGPSRQSALIWSLRHELAHWKCGDLWLIRLREAVRMLFYFHPAAWWAGKRLEVAIELACDRSVIANEAEAADYVLRLYEILDAVRNRHRQPLTGGLFATRSQIARRLAMLVESPLRLYPRLTRMAAVGISLLAVMVLAVGSGLQRDVNAQDTAAKSANTVRANETKTASAVQSAKDDESPAKEPVNVVGQVVNESGEPVAGVAVRLHAPAPDAATTKSDAEGRFLFSMRQEKLGTLVANDKEGKRMGYAECYPLSDKRYAPRITLRPVRAVIIKVIDARGAPVVGATYSSPGAQYDLDNVLFTGKTGDDGTARLQFSDDARAYQVIAYKSGLGFDYFVSPRPRDEERREPLPGEITLTLAGARALTFKAVDQKRQPVEGVPFSPYQFTKPGATDSISLGGCDAVQIRTNSSGTAVFDWLPNNFAGVLRFSCPSAEYAVREPRRADHLLWVRHDDPVKELTVPVLRRTAISGKVVDQDGKPRPGVIVKASGIGADSNNGRGEVITDSEGAYRMMVQSEQAYVVGVVDDRWVAPTRTGVVVRESQPVNGIDFKLNEGTILRGTVIDQSGRPLANRQVLLLLQGNQIPAEIGLPASQRSGDRRLYHHRMSQSDERGQFQFRVASGTYKLAASEIGAISAQTPQADVTIDGQREVVQDLRVQVDKTVRLKGSVVDPDGKPVANQQVFGFYLLQRLTTENLSLAAKTGADGSFEIDIKILPAILHVRIEDRKLGGLARLDADQNEVAIQLSHLVEAHGRFVDEKGQGVAGRRISSAVEFPVEKGGRRTFISEAITDLNGRFTLVGLLAGEENTIRVREDKPRVPVVTLTKVTIKGPGPVDLGDLRVPPIPDQEALTLKGKVIGLDGKPVAGAEVRAVFLQSWSRGRARTARVNTSAEGTFEIKRPAVPAVISVRTPDNLLGGKVQINERQIEVSLTAVPLGKARGILTESSGKSVPGSLIMASIFIRVPGGPRSGVLEASATTAADGSFTLEGLLPGESYEVRYMVINDRRVVTQNAELATVKLEKAETVELGKISLP
jgi:beta-lactamase regulating signal transducer with metallopeptidase domain/protocatechuate 3,4-dioxygenase beta subunit